jgi:hypothetical protein
MMPGTILQKAWILIIPPLAFFLKDIIATMILLSTEPRITPGAAFYYSLALLPGALVVSAGEALAINILFGVLLGGVLFLLVIRQNRSLQH